MVLMMNKHPNSLLEAKGIIGDEETSNLGHLSFLPLPKTVVLKVIEVHYPRCLQCHLGQTTKTDPDTLDKVGGIEKKCTKDAVTYQSWRWDLTVHRCAGCRDHTPLPYTIRSLQGYPGELVWSSGTDITLDDVLTI